MTARLRRIARRATRPVVRWAVGARFRNLPGVDVLRVGDDLHVYLDDASAAIEWDAVREYAVEVTPDLEYAGDGMVRVWWPTVTHGQQVLLTTVDELGDWTHRLDDVRGLSQAEADHWLGDSEPEDPEDAA